MKKIIKDDLFDISSRIKEIDDSYYIVYNLLKKRYEVHSTRQKGNSFCLVVPYATLDSRTLTLTRQTKSNRIKNLLMEIEKENKKREFLNK